LQFDRKKILKIWRLTGHLNLLKSSNFMHKEWPVSDFPNTLAAGKFTFCHFQSRRRFPGFTFG